MPLRLEPVSHAGNETTRPTTERCWPRPILVTIQTLCFYIMASLHNELAALCRQGNTGITVSQTIVSLSNFGDERQFYETLLLTA